MMVPRSRYVLHTVGTNAPLDPFAPRAAPESGCPLCPPDAGAAAGQLSATKVCHPKLRYSDCGGLGGGAGMTSGGTCHCGGVAAIVFVAVADAAGVFSLAQEAAQ